ncbi:hypothetical protein VNO77_24672 [Canavalia gladiata]|uniref:Uncharacterized protein n=1 Tax=Canavalia gladiata TaxID=3824 RepID=A0AAN9L6Q4_CANGL
MALATSASLCFKKKNLIPERCSTIYRKKNHAITTFADNSLGKSTIQLTVVSSLLFIDKEAGLSLGLPIS